MGEVDGCVWGFGEGCDVEIQVDGDERILRRHRFEKGGVGEAQTIEGWVCRRLPAGDDDLSVDFYE